MINWNKYPDCMRRQYYELLLHRQKYGNWNQPIYMIDVVNSPSGESGKSRERSLASFPSLRMQRSAVLRKVRNG